DLREESLELTLADYGIYPNEEITTQVIHALRLWGRKRGVETEIHAFAHYRRKSRTAYVYDFDVGVYRITAGGVDYVDNGTYGVLFIQKSGWKPLKLDFGSASAVDWRKWILSGVHFMPGDELSDEDQSLLFTLWVLTLFFPELFPTRIVLAL